MVSGRFPCISNETARDGRRRRASRPRRNSSCKSAENAHQHLERDQGKKPHWEIIRPEYAIPVMVYGRVESVHAFGGVKKPVWVDWQLFEGVPYDVPVIGYGVNTVNMLRLWSSRSTESFRLEVFDQGEYVKAMEEKNWAETITKVLYPSDHTYAGKELRLIQEYFLCTCTIRDIIRRYRKGHSTWGKFAEFLQLAGAERRVLSPAHLGEARRRAPLALVQRAERTLEQGDALERGL